MKKNSICFLIVSLAFSLLAQSNVTEPFYEKREEGARTCVYVTQVRDTAERYICIDSSGRFAALKLLGGDTLIMVTQAPLFPTFRVMTKGKIIFFHDLWQRFNGGGMISPLDGPEYDIERLYDTTYFNIVLFDENKLVYKLGDTTQVYEWRADMKKNLDYWAEVKKRQEAEKMNKEATQVPQILDEKKNEKPKPQSKSNRKPKSSQK